MTTNRIGITLETFEFAIKQGSAGNYNFVSVFLDEDDQPLPTYDGWTAKIELYRNGAGAAAITLEPTVTGDGTAHTLTVPFDFDEATTSALSPGIYRGDLVLRQPSTGKPYVPCDVLLTIERTFSLT